MRGLTKKECIKTVGGYCIIYTSPETGNEIVLPVAGSVGYGVAESSGHNNSSFINVGTAVGALVGGFMAGGPIGFGFALGSLVIATGINGLLHLHKH